MDLKLPRLGEGADSGVVVNVFVKEGDTIAKDQPLIELENEKAVASIPASAAGTVTKIHVKPGDKLSVGQTILSISESGKAAAPAPAAESPQEQEPAPARDKPEPSADAHAENQEEPGKPLTTPVASPSLRRLARDLGIDLNRMRIADPGGRAVIGDIRAYIERLQKLAYPPKALTTAATPPKPSLESVDYSKWGPVTKKTMTPLRQVIARRMWENWNAIPHVTQFDSADFTILNELRKKHASAYELQGARLTLTPMVLRALVDTLKKHPEFNSSFDEAAQQIVVKGYFHIGIAVDTEQGLIVPVIRDVDKKTLLELAKELEDLARKARERKVGAEELKGGTFTISNQGAIGGSHFTPIINKPEVAILGLGRGAMQPVSREGRIEARLMVPIAVSYDHRVIDGGMAARFVVDLVKALEQLNEAEVRL